MGLKKAKEGHMQRRKKEERNRTGNVTASYIDMRAPTETTDVDGEVMYRW